MDKEMLEKVMKEKGISINQMCKATGMGRKAFWRKRTGKTEFKQSEIAAIIDILGSEYGSIIFFPESVVKDTATA